MKADTDTRQTRRELVRSIGRGAALVGVALLAAWLVRRGGGGGRDGAKCINRGICRGCAAFKDCLLPAAASAKQASGKARS